MIKRIVRYETEDGSRFESEWQAIDYEALCQKIHVAMRRLGQIRPDPNGKNYVQHARSTKASVLAVLQQIPGCPRSMDAAQFAAPCWNKAFYTLQCIDDMGREWGQLYFTKHANGEAVMVPSSVDA